VLPEDYQDKKKGSSVAIKLHELGPRMKLKLHKIEEGFCRGNVVFHSVVKMDKGDIKKQSDSLKSKRELKEKRKKEQDANVKKKLDKKGPTKKDNKKEAGDDDYVTDPGEQSDVEEANADDNKEVVSTENKKERLFANFQKNGKIIPNITSVVKRPAGISKGLWKKEAKRQLTGVTEKKERRGMRVKKEDLPKKDASALGKRTKTSNSHGGKNTSTFKTQNKRQRK
jgi:hypothetical protein